MPAKWTPSEIQFLLTNIHQKDEWIAKTLNKSLSAVSKFRQRMGYKKPHGRPFKDEEKGNPTA